MPAQTIPHFHPWHHVHYGDHAPEVVNAIIEIPSGSMGKFELDKTTGLIRLDRVLFSSVHYPANYGFIPQTYGEDKDPLDILVFTSISLPHLCQVEARVIGVMRMIDQGEADDKIIAVASRDMSVKHLENIEEFPAHTLNQLQRFFEDYKKLENKEVVVENFLPRAEACRIIRESIARYQNHFPG